jgi:hypothetical protein
MYGVSKGITENCPNIRKKVTENATNIFLSLKNTVSNIHHFSTLTGENGSPLEWA